jgi:hypothetical protein
MVRHAVKALSLGGGRIDCPLRSSGTQASVHTCRDHRGVLLVLVAALALSCGSRMSHEDPSPVIAQRDTIWPVLSSIPDLDTSRVVALQDTLLAFRTDINLRFKTAISDSAKRAFFTRHSMSVVGVTQSGMFYVRIPDPGPSVQDLWDALDALRIEPEIDIVSFIPWTSMPEMQSAGPVLPPSDHVQENLRRSDTTWPLLIDRLADLDTTRLVQVDSGLLFRTDITLRFKTGISDSAKRDFFRRHSMSVVGVTQSGKFFVRIPDPGPRAQNLWDALDRLRIEPEVDIVTFISWTAMREVF